MKANGTEQRDPKGRFAGGNPGGPGRPRRTVEREYLATLNDAVSLDDWRDIVQAAVTAAKGGDGKARDWLCKYLIGEKPLKLADLAADEAADLDARQDILERLVKRMKDRDYLDMYSGGELQKARKLLQQMDAE